MFLCDNAVQEAHNQWALSALSEWEKALDDALAQDDAEEDAAESHQPALMHATSCTSHNADPHDAGAAAGSAAGSSSSAAAAAAAAAGTGAGTGAVGIGTAAWELALDAALQSARVCESGREAEEGSEAEAGSGAAAADSRPVTSLARLPTGSLSPVRTNSKLQEPTSPKMRRVSQSGSARRLDTGAPRVSRVASSVSSHDIEGMAGRLSALNARAEALRVQEDAAAAELRFHDAGASQFSHSVCLLY
jgi:hypothetical protein